MGQLFSLLWPGAASSPLVTSSPESQVENWQLLHKVQVYPQIGWPEIFLIFTASVAFIWWLRRRRTAVKDFIIQFRTAGMTGGSERQFLRDVSKLLSHQGVSLEVKEFTGNLRHLLLVFCPIASRMGTDIENALEGLSGEKKVLLVVMHLIPKDNLGAFVDTRQQVRHPAVEQTVHTCYTLQDSFYPCEMNAAAVVAVADFIKDLAKCH